MKKLKQKMGAMIQRVVDWGMGNGLMQEELTADGHDMVTPEMAALARRAGAEGCVLLKNDGTLPLKAGETVAVFGRCQLDWFYVGYGSGGDVHPPYRVHLMEGLKNAGIPIGVTALSDTAKDLRSADLKELAVVIGSEGQGVRQQILDSADAQLIIPMNPRCESLNAAVAATIVMWQMTRL
jgi:beta-glucosidase-like glycosyl hydrolase